MTASSDTRGETARDGNTEFTFGRIDYRVELFDDDTPARPYANRLAVDQVVAAVTALVGAAAVQINSYIDTMSLHGAKRTAGKKPYVTNKYMQFDDRSVRVTLTFDTNVDVPLPVLVAYSEQVLTGLATPMVEALAPGALAAALGKIVSRYAQILTDAVMRSFASPSYWYGRRY